MGIVNQAIEPKRDANEPVDDQSVPDENDSPDSPEPASDANEPTDKPGAPEESDSAGGEEDKPNVSPDEQAMYDSIVTAALNQMYAPDQFPQLCEKLKASQSNISKGIGHTGAMILKAIKGSVEGQGKTVPDDVLFAAAGEVVGQLCDIAIGIKAMDESQEKGVSEAAMYEGMRIWGQEMQAAGQIDPSTQAQAQADLKDAGVQQGQPAPAPAPPPQGIANAGAQ